MVEQRRAHAFFHDTIFVRNDLKYGTIIYYRYNCSLFSLSFNRHVLAMSTENKRPKFSWRLFQTFIIQKYFDFCLWVCMLHLFLSNYEGVGLPFIAKYDRKCKGRQLSPLFPKTRRVPFSFTCSFVWYQISRQPKTKVSFFVSLMQPGKESNAALFALLFLL